MCAGASVGRVTHRLGDLDLVSLEEEDSNLIYMCDELKKMAGHDHTGAIQMKCPEYPVLKDFALKEIIQPNDQLGHGSYGKVCAVEFHGVVSDAKAIHTILIENVSSEEQNRIKHSFIQECVRCSHIQQHPYVIQFLGVYYPSKASVFPIMVMELMDTSLTKVKNHKSKWPIMPDVAKGLYYLHNHKPQIHRDLSSNNVLLTKSWIAKIGDLGVAKVIQADSKQTKSKLTTAPGTPCFVPFGILVEDNPVYGNPIDVFSFVNIVQHVFSEEWPTPGGQKMKDSVTNKLVALSEAEQQQQYLDKMTGIADDLRKLVEQCFDHDPDDRPTIQKVAKTIESMKFQRDTERIIAIISDYYNGYNANNSLGKGGFTKVYVHVKTSFDSIAFAVKEEARESSLISDLTCFAEVLKFDHPSIMYLRKYVMGYFEHDGDKPHVETPLLFNMTHHNQPYVSVSRDQKHYLFRNYLDLFNALEYFSIKGLVCRDVKRSNILLKLTCNCSFATGCICRDRGSVNALFSDFDLIEKATNDENWARLGDHEAPGTNGMKALESVCPNAEIGMKKINGAQKVMVSTAYWIASEMKKEENFGHKADVWIQLQKLESENKELKAGFKKLQKRNLKLKNRWDEMKEMNEKLENKWNEVIQLVKATDKKLSILREGFEKKIRKKHKRYQRKLKTIRNEQENWKEQYEQLKKKHELQSAFQKNRETCLETRCEYLKKQNDDLMEYIALFPKFLEAVKKKDVKVY